MKAIISYFDNQSLVSSVEEAISFINSLRLRNLPNGPAISCNENVERVLDLIFNKSYVNENGVLGYDHYSRMRGWSQFVPVFPKELAATGCSNTRIYLYEPLGETLEEHQKAYQEKLASERAERIAESQRRKEARLAELNEEKEGWYAVSLNDIEVYGTFTKGTDRRIYKDFSGKVIAKSGADAYRKAAEHLLNNMAEMACTATFTYFSHSIPEMISGNYEFYYLGSINDINEF